MEYNSVQYTFDSMTLNDRHVWLNVIDTPIGNIYAVQYERPKPWSNVETKLFFSDLEKADAYYKKICKKMIDGKI